MRFNVEKMSWGYFPTVSRSGIMYPSRKGRGGTKEDEK